MILPVVMGKVVWSKRKIPGYKNVEGDLNAVKMLSQKVLINVVNTYLLAYLLNP